MGEILVFYRNYRVFFTFFLKHTVFQPKNQKKMILTYKNDLKFNLKNWCKICRF